MAWVLLVVAGMVEVAFVMALGHPGSFERLWPTVWVFVSGLVSLYLLAVVMKSLPVGTAFAVWAAMGAGGAAVLGIVFRGEAANTLRISGLVVVICGAVALRMAGG